MKIPAFSTTIRSFTLACALGACSAAATAQQAEPWVEGLTKPVDMAQDPTDPSRFFVVQQGGSIRVIESDDLLDAPALTIPASEINTRNWEQGLLGLAFDPGYAENGRLYINYTDEDGDTRITRVTRADKRTFDFATEELILTFEQPWGNHNGGAIRFGPDGMLWIGTGDGGAANDPRNYAQNNNSLLGKMLRVDVSGTPDAGLAYAIPSDNPFVGNDDYRPEIWATGLRNPWRYEWDPAGNLWIADVGQNRHEEIHLQPAGSKGGENYGWKPMEGQAPFLPGRKPADDPEAVSNSEHRDAGFEPPLWTYRHHPLGSITGGYVYTGTEVPSLRGRYIYADFMSGRIWSLRLRTDAGKDSSADAGPGGFRADDVVEHTRDFQAAFPLGTELCIGSFGTDRDGELYILDHKGGRVLKIVE
jgi:glucose/arabinose dehydrogenase